LTGEKILLNAEIVRDRLGRLRYTKVSVISDTLKNSMTRIVSAVNKLIDLYRMVSDEYWLYRIRREDILFISSEREFAYEGLSKAKPDISNQSLDRLKHLLSDKGSAPTFYLLFLDAKSALYEGKYALAIIYSITALEAIVKQFIKKKAEEKQLSDITLKQLENMYLSSLVKVVLRLLLSKDELTDELVKEFTKANKLRNNIIHEAETDISKESAEKATKMVLQMIGILYPKLIQ
jgi:hypothetical protein